VKTLVLLALFISGCSIEIGSNTSIEEQMQNYCKKCGGVSAGFVNDYGLELTCVDGTHLSQKYVGLKGTKTVLGSCK